MLFTQPYAEQSRVLLTNRVRGRQYQGRCPTLDEVLKIGGEPDRLAVQAETSHAEHIEDEAVDAQVTLYPSFAEMIEALNAGEVVAAFGGELTALWFLEQNPAYRIRIAFCELRRAKDRIAIAVRPDAPSLLNFLNVFLDERITHSDAEEII